MKNKILITCVMSLLLSVGLPKIKITVQTEEEEKTQQLAQQLESCDLVLMEDESNYTVDQKEYIPIDNIIMSSNKLGEDATKYVLVPNRNKSTATETEFSLKSIEKLQYLGTFIATGYCSCSKCCGSYANGITASGKIATPNNTIAVDTSIIPMGTKIIINGTVYTAEDTGGAIKGKRIDIYFASHTSALQWGRRSVDVYLYE